LNAITIIFLTFLIIEVIGGAIFIFVFRFMADWDRSPVGRNLLAFSTALTVADIIFAITIILGYKWLAFLLLASHLPISMLIWYRNVLLFKSIRSR